MLFSTQVLQYLYSGSTLRAGLFISNRKRPQDTFLRLDSKSIATALPVLQADVEEWMGGAGDGVVKLYSKLEEGARPYVDSALLSGKRLWAEGGEKVSVIACICEGECGQWMKLMVLARRCGKERGGWRENMGKR